MTTPEDLRREAPDGPEDDMRMDVQLDQVHIPTSTKWALGLMLSGIAGLVLWNLLTTLAIKESQANDNREVWIQFGKHEARMDVQDVRYEALKSQVEELKERK
jgi:hypothetical protein